MPSLKNNAASKRAEITRKKLKYVKYSPKSVAPRDADNPSARTSRTDNPAAKGSIAARNRAMNGSRNSPGNWAAADKTRTEVRSPYRERHNRCPTSNGTKAFGVVRYRFQ